MKALPSIALAAAVAASLLPSTARARFGKSSGTSAGTSTSSAGPHTAAPASGHAPNGPGSSDGRHGPSYGRGFPYYYGGYYGPYYYGPGYYGPGYYGSGYYGYGYGDGFAPYYYTPPPMAVPPPPPGAIPPPPYVETSLPPRPTTAVGFDGQHLISGGTAYAVGLSIEGRRWGINGLFTGLILPSDSAQGEFDALRMLDAHLTYALLQGPRGRLRIEAGFDSVFAQDVVVLGPDGGASVSLDLLGPLGIEGSTHFAPWPHRRFDAGGGLTLALGPLSVRGGWRYLLLDDNGVLKDGSRNIDHFNGPYVGLAVAL
jgi:hypothetical protein